MLGKMKLVNGGHLAILLCRFRMRFLMGWDGATARGRGRLRARRRDGAGYWLGTFWTGKCGNGLGLLGTKVATSLLLK